MAEETPDTQVYSKFNNVRADDYRSVYSNNATFQVGVFDYCMLFGEVSMVDEKTQTITVEQRVKVIMSLLHAKIFVYTALQQLRQFEKVWGEIKIPEGLIGGPPIEANAPAKETEKKQ